MIVSLWVGSSSLNHLVLLLRIEEMKTLAGAVEHLLKGEVGKLGDVLTQRLKALELGLSGQEAAGQAVQLIALQLQV